VGRSGPSLNQSSVKKDPDYAPPAGRGIALDDAIKVDDEDDDEDLVGALVL
jgi:hypothetical protein